MESGKWQIGRERAKKIAEALHVSDYRVFLYPGDCVMKRVCFRRNARAVTDDIDRSGG